MKRIKWHLLCWGPPSDLDTPGPSSVVCKYHQPLNEQRRDKSLEMKLQTVTGSQKTPKAFIFSSGFTNRTLINSVSITVCFSARIFIHGESSQTVIK